MWRREMYFFTLDEIFKIVVYYFQFSEVCSRIAKMCEDQTRRFPPEGRHFLLGKMPE